MAENDWSDETKKKDVLDFGGYHTNDDSNENGIRNTPFVSAGQKETLSLGRENDTNLGTGYTYPRTASSASESSTAGTSIYTTENDLSAQEQHDYNQQGTTPVVSVEQMTIPSIRPEDDLHIEFGSTLDW